ncbi:unnamed protein product [Rotaria sordida]|uniref:Fructose-2,6-bisphosphatase TIGAR n=1 Tax=Rotaria sordida TaxID=392033 RepID=A0A814JTR2_9BILA|nr:unnamed protein product [Rotaria sordida]CAF1239623.1 unnamed protein product [Rotaria sordida]
MISTINRDYTSTERIGLALTMALVTEAYSRIVPIAQNAVTGNNTRLFEPKKGTVQLDIPEEPIFLHGHVFGYGDPERKYIEDVQLDGPILRILFDINASSPQESDHDKQVSWNSDEMNKVVRRLETEIENIRDTYKVHGLTIITRNSFIDIYIVRHGETDWNAQKRLQGHTDIPLSAQGKLQAYQLKEKFADIHFSKIFSSDLIRARSTAELIRSSNKLPIIETPLLRERCMGTWEGRLAESLANELLLYLFEFLDGIHLFRAFHNLNSRFNHLLFIHFRAYRFDFRSISKYEFDIICQYYLPSIIDQIISLTISDDDETPSQSEIFLSYNFTLDKFIHLQSLTLYSIQSFDKLDQLIFQCCQLPYLTHLYMIDGYNDGRKNDIQFLINNIWSLPKLYYFYLNYHSSSKIWLNKISIISLSIEKLFIENITCTLQDLSHLFKYTPSLQYLNTTIHFNFEDEQIPIVTLSSITSLKLTFESVQCHRNMA